MFPYRRGKKRGKGNGGGGRRFEPGRRPPSSAQELLQQMQPATKALAQALASGARISGPLGHARNLLGQAERLVEEHGLDRLAPSQREEFLEQLARLKLTVADADAAVTESPPSTPQPTVSVAPIAKERLRELALSLAVATPREPPPAAPPVVDEVAEPVPSGPTPAAPEPAPAAPPGSPRAERLRLKTTVLPRGR
ncbi:MAG: hypothetical protein WHV64_17945 [Geminicoccaceae bacterium]|jgi:hypothetical protein